MSQIRTDGFTGLQSVALDHSATTPYKNTLSEILTRVPFVRELSLIARIRMSQFMSVFLYGGSCEIRTHGPFTVASFQDWWFKPLTQTSV